MDVPGIVRERLGDERRMTSVNIGGDDRVYVTPPRTLVYHSSGLFSRESIEEYSHDARRFDVSADRREASFAFEYDDGVRGFSVPRERIETILPPILAGVLRSNGLIESEESIEESYRFGERTLVITDTRILTSVGEAVWDRDNESYDYENVTDLRFENGTLVIEIGGRTRRIELSGDGRREAYETAEDALFAYHGIDSVEELPQQSTERGQQARADGESTASEWAEPTGDTREASSQTTTIENAESDTVSPSPPSSPPPDGQPSEPPIQEVPESDETDTGMQTDESGTETQTEETATPERDDTSDTPDLTEELDALRESVERQTELIEHQQETLDRLAETLDTRVSDDR